MYGYTRDPHGNRIRAVIPVYVIGQNADGEHCILKTSDLVWSKKANEISGLMRAGDDCIRTIFGYTDNESKMRFIKASRILRRIVFDLRYITTYDYERKDTYTGKSTKIDPFSIYFCKLTHVTVKTINAQNVFKRCTPTIQLHVDVSKIVNFGRARGCSINFRWLIHNAAFLHLMMFRVNNRMFFITNVYDRELEDMVHYKTLILKYLRVLKSLIFYVYGKENSDIGDTVRDIMRGY